MSLIIILYRLEYREGTCGQRCCNSLSRVPSPSWTRIPWSFFFKSKIRPMLLNLDVLFRYGTPLRRPEETSESFFDTYFNLPKYVHVGFLNMLRPDSFFVSKHDKNMSIIRGTICWRQSPTCVNESLSMRDESRCSRKDELILPHRKHPPQRHAKASQVSKWTNTGTFDTNQNRELHRTSV